MESTEAEADIDLDEALPAMTNRHPRRHQSLVELVVEPEQKIQPFWRKKSAALQQMLQLSRQPIPTAQKPDRELELPAEPLLIQMLLLLLLLMQ